MVKEIIDFNLVILNAYILNRHYGSQKLTQDEYRDYLVKYLLWEGLECYSIPLPPVMSRKIGRNNILGHDTLRLKERHFITNIPAAEGRKRKRPTRSCFCKVNCKVWPQKANKLHFGVKTVVRPCV